MGSSPLVSDVTDANFDSEVLGADGPVLVDFWATWCAPCKALSVHVDTLADENEGALKVVKMDVQRNMRTAGKFKVSNLPTLIVFKNGAEVGRQVGAAGGVPALRRLVGPHL